MNNAEQGYIQITDLGEGQSKFQVNKLTGLRTLAMLATLLANFSEDEMNLSYQDFSDMLDALKADYLDGNPSVSLQDDTENMKDILNLLANFLK